MTREEIMTLGFEELEERKAAIAVETDEADAEVIETLNAELEMIEERKKALDLEIEERKAAAEAVIAGAGVEIETRKEEKPMTNMEVRQSKEYLDAWVEMLKGRATVEQRALLTENGDGGTIAVPEYVEDRVNTAWENNEIIRRVRRSYFKGNLRVPVEVSANGAFLHEEGSEAITEEELVIQFVNLVPRTYKKMVKYSTEVMDLKGQAWVDYIFDEIEYRIIKTIADEALVEASESPLISTYTAAGATLTAADIVNAEGLLGGEASNPVLITTRASAAALKAAALSAGYGYDPFDGMDVIFVDASVMTNAGALGIVADLSGIQMNFPNGDQPTFVFDEFTEAPADIVRVIGRLMVGMDVVATGKVVLITPDESASA